MTMAKRKGQRQWTWDGEEKEAGQEEEAEEDARQGAAASTPLTRP